MTRREEKDGVPRRGAVQEPFNTLGLHDEIATLKQALAQVRVQLRKEILEANSDPATGLLNKRGLEKSIGSSQSDVDNGLSQGGVAIAMDMRYLKIVNDTYGHGAGNKAIETFAEKLKENCRDEDIIARTGGDEFVLIMPDLSPQETSQRRSGLKDALKELDFKYGKHNIIVGVRMGVSKYDATISITQALKTADEREGAIRKNLKKFEPPRY